MVLTKTVFLAGILQVNQLFFLFSGILLEIEPCIFCNSFKKNFLVKGIALFFNG